MSIQFRAIFFRLRKISVKILFTLGFVFLFLLVFSFTSGPFWMYYRLGTKRTAFTHSPGYIVLLGGGGMPSESNLIRAYYTASLAQQYPCATIIVALPGDTADTSSTTVEMAMELELRGVLKNRIVFEPEGVNTRSQALNCIKLTSGQKKNDQVVLVTSPEHMRRSLLSFRKAGFERVGGYPAFEHTLESELSYKNKDLGGRKGVPVVDESITLRYRFWIHLKYEVIIMREYVALFYYKLKGWV